MTLMTTDSTALIPLEVTQVDIDMAQIAHSSGKRVTRSCAVWQAFTRVFPTATEAMCGNDTIYTEDNVYVLSHELRVAVAQFPMTVPTKGTLIPLSL